MPWSMKVALLSVVVCLAGAGLARAEDQQRRGRGRGRDARVVVQPRVVVRPPVIARRHAVPRAAPRYYHQSRLRFRPVHRPGLGIGIYIGSPARYRYPAYRRPYYSPYPTGAYYGYVSPYAYAAPSYGAIYAVPAPNSLYGGVRLDIEPRDAAVYVDGYYAGIVDDFDGAWQRIALEPGPHRFEVVAPGYEPLEFEVNVRPHQTVRYRGDLRWVGP